MKNQSLTNLGSVGGAAGGAPTRPTGVPMATLFQPKVVAIATDEYLIKTKASNRFQDPILPAGHQWLTFGQDLLFSVGRPAPSGQSVGTDEKTLKPKAAWMVDMYAAFDRNGMARRLFNDFLAKQSHVRIWTDNDLNQVAAQHSAVKSFISRSISAPNMKDVSVGKKRIHQALAEAKWDIRRYVAPTDLGVPAFNSGGSKVDKALRIGDFGNGLGVMINGVQYVYVVATYYKYDSVKKIYDIHLKYYFYDVFGLDDDDLAEYGATTNWNIMQMKQGITAWWQLQHQFNYAPLVTRVTVDYQHRAPAV